MATVEHIELFSIEMERATASSLGESIILDNAYDATVIQVESGTSFCWKYNIEWNRFG